MRQVFDLIIQAAPSPHDDPDQRRERHRQGAGGAGAAPELARASDRAFITVNSGNLPPDLLESNLFGHVKGAFTGAVYPKKGLFELADKGTIFFDEIGNIPLETQAKLLRVIQEREFMRLGGVETIKVDVRIIAATNVDLRRMMDEGRFREDLYYRLHVITVQLPALRERKDDIPLLVQHFLEKYGEENHKTEPRADARGARPADGVRLAGQRARARERHRARGRCCRPASRIDADLVPDHVRSSRRFQMPQFVVPPEGISFREVDHRLREAADRVDARGRRRRAEARRRAPAHQADDAERDDQAPRHPAAPQARGAPAAGDARAGAPSRADDGASDDDDRRTTTRIDRDELVGPRLAADVSR